MQFDGTISAGSIISAAIFLVGTVGGWLAFRSRIDAIVTLLAARFEKHEAEDRQMFMTINASILKLVADTSRLIGRSEADETPAPHGRRKAD